MSVRDLRRAWKPHKQRLAADRGDHPTNIRFHRACSWLQRVEAVEDEADLDLVLTGQWIAFNALYGQWDEQAAEPRPDRECWRAFLDRILALDTDGRIAEVLSEHHRLVLAILDDTYLAKFFWRDPSLERALRTTRDRHKANTWYLEKRWALILDHAVDQIYRLRCQVLHGASTYGSRLNRTSLRRCTTMMGHLLPAMLQVWIDHGADEDWGPMSHTNRR